MFQTLQETRSEAQLNPRSYAMCPGCNCLVIGWRADQIAYCSLNTIDDQKRAPFYRILISLSILRRLLHIIFLIPAILLVAELRRRIWALITAKLSIIIELGQARSSC